MKKTLFSFGLCLALISGAFASNNVLDQLNSEVINILAPFQNETTSAQLTFNAIETNAERIVKVAVNGFYKKIGSQNIFEVKLDNLSYDYGNGLSPTTIIKSSVGIDFTKLLPQEQLNMMIPMASEMLEQIAKEQYEDYGDAISMRSVITSTTKDSEGNYTALTALVSAKVDLSKLPEDMASENVMATDVVFSLTINLKTGVAVDAFFISNPDYIGFKENEIGLKEVLDKLLARDEEAMDEILGLIQTIDEIATQLVEMNNLLKYFGIKSLMKNS
ncbi:hypothetical protein EP47_09015 [Legionella norrlandica]|uniref:Uncharacterized protein n=1 Tax=Legionella norrlandica TaxID=1498499 RepID=A0A0A2SQM4_9GAMM|nr:hypothetical protein [Legionella norrlandica]KGP63062.1 hypothetical protein EP47_09015 [Legionella norrlandica]